MSTIRFRRHFYAPFWLLNRYSMENGSNTPDFMLADYLIDCLRALDKTWQEKSPVLVPGEKSAKAMIAAMAAAAAIHGIMISFYELE